MCSLEKPSKKLFLNNDDGLKTFCDINLQVPNQHAAQKINYVQGNQLLFMTKQFSKETSKFAWTLDNIRIEKSNFDLDFGLLDPKLGHKS